MISLLNIHIDLSTLKKGTRQIWIRHLQFIADIKHKWHKLFWNEPVKIGRYIRNFVFFWLLFPLAFGGTSALLGTLLFLIMCRLLFPWSNWRLVFFCPPLAYVSSGRGPAASGPLLPCVLHQQGYCPNTSLFQNWFCEIKEINYCVVHQLFPYWTYLRGTVVVQFELPPKVLLPFRPSIENSGANLSDNKTYNLFVVNFCTVVSPCSLRQANLRNEKMKENTFTN